MIEFGTFQMGYIALENEANNLSMLAIIDKQFEDNQTAGEVTATHLQLSNTSRTLHDRSSIEAVAAFGL